MSHGTRRLTTSRRRWPLPRLHGFGTLLPRHDPDVPALKCGSFVHMLSRCEFILALADHRWELAW